MPCRPTRRVHRISLLVCIAACACLGLHRWERSYAPTHYAALDPAELLATFASETVAGSGLRLPGWMTWGASVILGDDGQHHMFFSRWPEQLGHNAWVTSSEVAHAVASSPLGPWSVRGVALPHRGPRFWDGQATHNPSVLRHPRTGEFVLFYIGMTYDSAPPSGGPFTNRTLYEAAWNTKRVGVATAATPYGPWRRLDAPVLSPRPGEWDGAITSNPTAAFLPDGATLLVYKSIALGYPQRSTARPKPFFHLGAALAAPGSVRGPYRRLNGGAAPLLPLAAEDPFLWRCAASGRLHLLFKAMLPIRHHHASVAVPGGWLAYTHSAAGGGLGWWAPPRLAFNRTLRVVAAATASASDGAAAAEATARGEGAAAEAPAPAAVPARGVERWLTADRLERPQLLFRADGAPSHAFVAMMRNGSSANVVLRLARARGE